MAKIERKQGRNLCTKSVERKSIAGGWVFILPVQTGWVADILNLAVSADGVRIGVRARLAGMAWVSCNENA